MVSEISERRSASPDSEERLNRPLRPSSARLSLTEAHWISFSRVGKPNSGPEQFSVVGNLISDGCWVWRRGTDSWSFSCRHSYSGATSWLRFRPSRWQSTRLSAYTSTFSTRATLSLETTWSSITTSSGPPITLGSISLYVSDLRGLLWIYKCFSVFFYGNSCSRAAEAPLIS